MKNSTTRTFFLPAALLAALLAGPAFSAIFVQPTVTGTTPSGIQWSAVATGTALPIRTTATSAYNGAPGAVAYFNTTTGDILFDPKGLSITTFILTYTTGTVNVTGTTPGPFQYTTGTSTNAWSPTTGSSRTFPAVTALSGLAPTTFASRVGATIGAPLGPSLATSGDAGNIASTDGFWNQPWAFPADLVKTGSAAVMTIGNFKTIGQGTNANANILGWGSQMGVFQYSANGIVGNQVGAVIPFGLTPATISATPSSLGNFTTTAGNASASQSFTVNGTGLTANLTATAPANFQVSSDNSTFSSNLTLTQSGGNVTATTLYARLAASAPTGPLSGNLTLASTGATTQNVTLSGTVAALPLISVTPSSLVGFATTTGTASGTQTLTVNGTNLTANLTIGAPAGFEVSTDNSSFSSSLDLSPAGGTVTDTTIHTRIAASAAAGPLSGNLTLASTGATTQNVSLSGTVAALPLVSVAPSSLVGFATITGSASGTQSFTVNGTNLTANLTIAAPADFEVSSDNSSFSGQVEIAPVGGSVAETSLYARISATAPVGAPSGNVTVSSSGAASQFVAVSGTVAGVPSISATPAILNNFSAIAGSASGSQSFTVSGINLGANITVTAPANFEVSADNVEFSGGLNLAPSAGAVSETSLYARIASGSANGPVGGNIALVSSGATTKYVSVSGSVAAFATGLEITGIQPSGLDYQIDFKAQGEGIYWIQQTGDLLTNWGYVSGNYGTAQGGNNTILVAPPGNATQSFWRLTTEEPQQ